MKFEEALAKLRDGVRVRRGMWSTNTCLQIQHDEIRLCTGGGLGEYWVIGQRDVLAEDWEEYSVPEQ